MANNVRTPEINDLATKLELLRIIECPVCQEVPFPPIYQCIRGHNICKNCKPKLKDCPTCRGSLSEVRNYTVEQMVLASTHSCSYKEDGCSIELRGELMESHLNNCTYRPFKCPWFGQFNCSTNLLRLILAKHHILTVHTNAGISMGPTRRVHHHLSLEDLSGQGTLRQLKKTIIWPPIPIGFDGKGFFLFTFAMNRTICFTALCVGSEEVAQKYRVKIICQPDKEMETQWIVPVKSIMKGTELLNTKTRYNMLIASCTLGDLLQMAEIREVHVGYKFSTHYTILKK